MSPPSLDAWLPDWLSDLATYDPLAADPVIVAEIAEAADEYRRYRQCFTGLVPPEYLAAVLANPGGIGHDVNASGPHPVDSRGIWSYTPHFWIDAIAELPDGLEPLVVSWESAGRRVLWPDQGLLMTYGLVPRLVAGGVTPTVHWDDPAAPRPDVVVATPLSEYDFPAVSRAVVTVARDVLQDYATIRVRALVQVSYAKGAGPLTEEIRRILGGHEVVEHRSPGRLLDIRIAHGEREFPILVQVWSVRLLLRPDVAPVSAGRWEYGTLAWPGFPQLITGDMARGLGPLAMAFVRDTVLGAYEGRPEFSIHPESGSVSHGGQWSVSPARRIGRDLIAVDLKKLYEGNRPETVRHWHAHAVLPPPDSHRVGVEPNVGTRARRIVYGLAQLGEALAGVAATPHSATGRDYTGIERAALDYSGWWTAAHVEPITRHAPLTLGKDAFLKRCDDLYKLVVEGLAERRLRSLLGALGIPPDDIKDFRSLRLLDQVVRLAELVARSGLRLRADGAELHQRSNEEPAPSPIAALFALNALRQLADHRSGEAGRRKVVEALAPFGVNPSACADGWGAALDTVYDGVADVLESATAVLARASLDG